MNHQTENPPKFAIIDHNMLAGIGLADLLEMIMPSVSVRTFLNVDELKKVGPEQFVHFFVSAQVYIENANFFRAQKTKSIVLTNGDSMPQLTQIPTLNVCQTETKIIRDILSLRKQKHQNRQAKETEGSVLSTREIEVLVLIVKGLINKEIAEELCISLTTVISHRKNLMDKLGIRTVSGLTVYALLNGYLQISDLQ